MKWVSIKDSLPCIIDINKEDHEECEHRYIFLIKNDYNRIERVIGHIYKSGGYSETYTKEEYNKIITTVENHPLRHFIIPECSVGKHCSSAEIDIDILTHWMKLPEEPKD